MKNRKRSYQPIKEIVKSDSLTKVIKKIYQGTHNGKLKYSKYLSKSLQKRKHGISVTLDLFTDLREYQIESEDSCECCGKPLVYLKAYLQDNTEPISIAVKFDLDKKRKWKISDLSWFQEDEYGEVVQSSIIDDIDTPEDKITELFDQFKNNQITDYERTTALSPNQIEGLSEIMFSFFLGFSRLKIIESIEHDEYEHSLIIAGIDDSKEAQIEIIFYRMLTKWMIVDIMMPKQNDDGTFGEKRSIFGFEKDDAEGDNK